MYLYLTILLNCHNSIFILKSFVLLIYSFVFVNRNKRINNSLLKLKWCNGNHHDKSEMLPFSMGMIAWGACVSQPAFTYSVPSTVVTSGGQSDSQQIFTEYFTLARQCARVLNTAVSKTSLTYSSRNWKSKQWREILQRREAPWVQESLPFDTAPPVPTAVPSTSRRSV